MKNFAVFLHGNNLLLSTRNGEHEIVGFFVTKRVEASTEEEAADLAIKAVMKDGFSHSNGSMPASELLVKVIHELPSTSKMKDTDYVFF